MANRKTNARSASQTRNAASKKTSGSRTSRAASKRQDKGADSKAAKFLTACIVLVVLVGGALIGWKYFADMMPGGPELTPVPGASTAPPWTDDGVKTFYPGVFVDGVDMQSYTLEDAKKAWSDQEARMRGAFLVRITIDGTVYAISDNDAGLTFDAENRLNEAYALGRVGTQQERQQAITAAAQTPVRFTTSMVYDKEALRKKVNEITALHYSAASDAQLGAFDATTKQYAFVAERMGTYVDADKLYQQLLTALDEGEIDKTITVTSAKTQPSVTMKMLEENFGLVTSFTTQTTDDAKRNNNIRLASDTMQGRVLAPGETFSFNESTGIRSREKGYQEATVIVNGEYQKEPGGGVCQVSTTLFNAAMQANIELVERFPHSIPAKYVPFGLDAMVDFPSADLKFRNSTNLPMAIRYSFENNVLTVEIYGQKLVEGKSVKLAEKYLETIAQPETKYVEDATLAAGQQKVQSAGRLGYRTETFRVYYQDGVETSRVSLFKSYYRPAAKVIHVAPGEIPVPVDPNAPTATPQPSAEPTPVVPEPTDVPTVVDPVDPQPEETSVPAV